jgi:uncharacterized membrane protein HdeD (DUF308 family)
VDPREIDAVSRGWWVLLVTGVASVVAGGIIVFTDWTVGDLAWFIGALLVFRGTTAIAGSISGRRFIPYWGVILAGDIAEVAVSFDDADHTGRLEAAWAVRWLARTFR